MWQLASYFIWKIKKLFLHLIEQSNDISKILSNYIFISKYDSVSDKIRKFFFKCLKIFQFFFSKFNLISSE